MSQKQVTMNQQPAKPYSQVLDELERALYVRGVAEFLLVEAAARCTILESQALTEAEKNEAALKLRIAVKAHNQAQHEAELARNEAELQILSAWREMLPAWKANHG